MKLRSILPAVGLLVLPLAGCQAPAPESVALSDEDVATLTAVASTYVERTLAKDFAGVAALFTEGGKIFPPNAPTVSGRAAIEAYLVAYPTINEFDIQVVEVAGSGDVAVTHGTFRLNATVEGMPDPINDTGKWMTSSERQADGSWLAILQMWNSDLPMPGT